MCGFLQRKQVKHSEPSIISNNKLSTIMKKILTALILLLFTISAYPQARLVKDIDFDGVLDTVSIDHSTAIISCQLSSVKC